VRAEGAKIYYAVGFSAVAGTNVCGPGTNRTCDARGWDPTSAVPNGQACVAASIPPVLPGSLIAAGTAQMPIVPNARVNPAAAPTQAMIPAAGVTVTANAFTAGAVGNIANNTAAANMYDSWTIDQNKNLLNTNNGI
jgi:hypothetical protein